MSQVKTTLIERIEIDRDRVAQGFGLWRVGYQDYRDKSERDKRLASLASDIYAAGRVLALQRHGKAQSFYVLMRLGERLELTDSRLTLASMDLQQADTWLIANLLVKSLPMQLKDSPAQQSVNRFEAEGLYYQVRNVPLKSCQAMQVVAVEVGMAPQPLARSGQMLTVSVRTFTPVAAFVDEQGQLSGRLQRSPRYLLNQRMQYLHKSINGDYLKRGLSRRTRKRVPLLDLGKQTYSDYQNSKLGIFSQFLRDLQQAYGGAMVFEFQSVQVSDRYNPKASEIKEVYRQVWQILSDQPITIIDKVGDVQAVSALNQTLEQRGFSVSLAQEPVPGICALMFVPPKEHFEGAREQDPYHLVKQAHAGQVIQACYVESILDRQTGVVNAHVLDVLLKEILFKLELKQQLQLLDGYPIPAGCLFIQPWQAGLDEEMDVSEANSPNNFLILEQRNGGLLTWQADEAEQAEILDSIADDDLRERLQSPYWRRANIPFVYWPDTGDVLAFIDSEAVVLPDLQHIDQALLALAKGRSQSIPATLLREFCELYSGSKVVPELLEILSNHQIEYGFEDLKSITNRKGDPQLFYAWLADQLGAPLKLSFQGSGGVLDFTTGMQLDQQQGLYFAGSVGSPRLTIENASHLYQLRSTLPEIPQEILRLMQVMHVKHKGFTVYPLPFKYLREFAELLRFGWTR